MPIFELGNNKQRDINLDDPSFTQFILTNPDATTVEEYNGKQYRIKARDYALFNERRNDHELERAGVNPYTARLNRESNLSPHRNEESPYFGPNLATRVTGDFRKSVRENEDARRKIVGGQVMPTMMPGVYVDGDDRYLTRMGHAENVGKAREDADEVKEVLERTDLGAQLDNLAVDINDGMREVSREMTAARREYEDNRDFGDWATDAIMSASVAELPVLQGQLPGSQLEITDSWRALQERDNILGAAARLYNKGQELRLAVANDEGFNAGLSRTLFAGLISGDDRHDSRLIEATVQKFKNKESLTREEDILLKALALNAAASAEYGEDLDIWYNVGQTTGEMVPLMLEMYSNPLSGFTKSAGRNFFTRGMKNLGGGVARGYGMALTTGLPDVVRGTQERMRGNATYNVEPNGEIKYTGQTEGADGLTAFYQSATNRMIENATEMFGARYIGRPINWLAKAGRNTKLLGWMDNFARSKYGRQFRQFAKATKWHGPIEEFFEEMHSGIANPILTGEGSVSDFFDGDNLATTALSVLVPGAAFATVNTAVGINNGSFKAGAQELSRMQQSEANAAVAWRNKNEEWNGLKDKIDNGSIEDVDALLREVQNRSDLTSDQKITAFRYGINNMRYRTARGVSEALNEKDKLYPMLRDIYARYYTAMPTGESALKASKELNNTELKAKEALGLKENESIEAFMGEKTVEEVANGSAVIAEALNNYLGAKAAFEGIQDRFQDARNEEYNRYDRGIDDNANNGVLYSTTYNGENVFITSGNVILLDNGKIDYDNSSSELIVRFPDGHKEMVATEKFSEDVQALNAEEVKAVGRAKIDEKWQVMFDNAEAKDIENEKRNSGILFEVSDELGVHSIEVIEEGADDSKILFDGKEMSIGTDELNQWRKEAGVSVSEMTEALSGVAPVQTNGPVVKPIPMEKRGNEERAAYHLVPIERTMEELHDGALDFNEITALINARIKEAYADVQSLEKGKPKEPKMPTMGASKEAYLKAKAKVKEDFARANEKWSAELQEAKQRWEYYNELYKREEEITRSEMAENYANVKPAEVVEMTPESFRAETGLGNSEQAEMVGYIAGADKGGVTIEQAAEGILENYSEELRGLGFQGDVQEVRDIIIDILSKGNPRSYAKNGLRQRKQESVDQQRAEMESVAVELGFESIEEMKAYEEQVIPGIIQLYTGFDYDYYYSNLAENYRNDTTRESETVGRGGELLQGEQSIDNAGVPVVEGNTGGAVSNSVQSNGENVAPQGNQQQVNVPVGNSEQLSSSEIPNNPTISQTSDQVGDQVAEGDAPGQSGAYSLSELTDNEGNRFFQKNGSIDLWDLSPLFVQARRQNAPIRLTERNIDHILDEHKKELGDSEESVLKFLDDVFSTAKVLRKARSGGIFVVVENTKTDKAAIIRLYPSKYGDYYNVESAGYYRKNKWKDTENVIAELSEPTQSVTAYDVSKPQVPEEGGKELLNAETATTSEGEDRNFVSNEQENAQKSDEIAENGGENMYSPEELAEAKEQLGELNATSAPEFAARLFSIKPWKTLEEANAALKELLASYGETLNGQSLAVIPFLDKAQKLIADYKAAVKEPTFTEEVEQVAENVETKPVNEAENVNAHSVIKSENEKKALRKRAEKWAKKLGVKVHVLESYDEVTDEQAKVVILEQRTPGWFAGGEVYIYMPHLVDEVDLDRTVVHETVAHKGIKQMLGEEFNKFLDNVWNAMSIPARAKFLSYVGAGKNATQADRRAAADEYVAALAEKVYKKQGMTAEEKTIWQKIADWFRKAFNVDEAKAEVLSKETLTDEDIAKMIRASYETLQSNKVDSEVASVDGDRAMFSKKNSERRQEKNRINNVIDSAVGIIMGSKEVAKRYRLKKEAERKQLAKEMYASVLKGDFNDVTLSQIDKFIEDATPANPFGRRISQRLPQRMERALRQGARANAVDALFSRISESAVPANERFSEAGRREIEERKKELLKGWAIATGNWHTDLKEFTDDTEPIGEGKDSKVYSSKDGRYVIKASKGKPFGKRFRPDIDNIALFNDVFRDTRYEILGYGEIDGEFVRILQQPIVDFAGSTPLTSEERREYMQSLGFEPLNDANTAFADGEIVIADLQKGNIVRDAAGNISVIDADAKLHTKDVGGDYTYPPVEDDLPEDSGTRFRKVTPEMDAEYMTAVENGDMETAERLVKEAAKMAMPDTKVVDENGYPMVVYHQTNSKVYINVETGENWDDLDWKAKQEWDERDDWEDYWEEQDFNTFSRVNARATHELDGFFFAPEYDEYHEYGDRTIAAFLNITNPASREDYDIDGSVNNAGREERLRLQNEGFDGVIREEDGKVWEYIAFDPNQIKSADAVTYDDNGNVIPLSERFNEEKSDIRFRTGSGPLTDREVVMESDVYSKVLGKPRYYGQKQRNYVARQRAKMAQKATELAEKLNTPIELRETAEGLTGKKAKAKGWYDVKSGNIVVVVSNHGSIEDIQATVLHEVVAHKGLRQMFGEHFDTFLDNVYNNVDAEIRAEIDALTEKYGNTREATEEYLASLAENTYFEKVNPSLWSRIKQWFLNMLTEVGIKLDFELSDNELRYILWRSHQRLVNPGIYNPVTRITDVAVRARLGIGEYAPAVEEMSHVAEEDAAEMQESVMQGQTMFRKKKEDSSENISQNSEDNKNWLSSLFEKAIEDDRRRNREEDKERGEGVQVSSDFLYSRIYGEIVSRSNRRAEGRNPVEVETQIQEANRQGGSIYAQTQTQKLQLEALRKLTNNEINTLRQEIESLLGEEWIKSDEYAESREKFEDFVRIIQRFKGRNERRFVVEKLTGARIDENIPLSKIDELFEMFNSDKGLAELYVRVKERAEEVGLSFSFSDNLEEDTYGKYSPYYNHISFNANMLYLPILTQQEKAETIVHEMIHTVTQYAIRIQENRNEGATPRVDISQELLDAAQTLIDIYEGFVRGNEALTREKYDIESDEYAEFFLYGTTNVHEMVSELSNPVFRNKLEKINYKGRSVLQAIWDTIKSIFINAKNKQRSAYKYEDISKAFDTLVNNFDKNAYAEAWDISQPLAKKDDLLVGSDNSSNPQEEETRFRTVEETTDGSIDDVPAQPMTLMERITNSLLEVSAKNKENLELRADALRTYGRDLKDILKLMRAQREYDKSTVDALVKMAKMFFKNAQLMGEVSTYEVGRILGVINNVVGRKNIADNAEKLMDILVDAHNKALGRVLEKAEKVKPKKVNAAGVEVIGALDKFGQEMVGAYNAGKELSGKPLNDAVSEAYDGLAVADEEVRMVFGLDAEADVERFVNGYTPTGEEQKDAVIEGYKTERAKVQGYELAREFVDNIKSAKAEIADLEEELKNAYQEKRKGVMSQEAYNEFRRSTMNAIFESKISMVDAYHSLISKFSEGVRESGKRAKAFQQAQIDRVKEIQHNANSDLQGHTAIVQGEKPTKNNNALMRTLMASQPTLQTILKKFGEKAVDGRGYLYDRFMGQATMASHNEFQGIVAARAMIETKLKEIYGDSYGVADFVKDSNKPGIVIEYKEGVNTKKFELTRGQMLYICMADKMTDGQMKLRRMGITEETVNEIRSKLPEEMVTFAEWVQNDLMNTLRNKYNAVHEKLFGAPMATIENYFPIKIRKEVIGDKKELGQDAEAKPSTVTGSIIKRTKNSLALDLQADAMQVLLEHIDQMEHWAAFAEFNRDMNSLLNYRHFQNQVKGMTTLRFGSGDMLWKNFEDVVNIATENYRPTRSEIDKAVLNMTKAITRSKINFRFYTALKQLLSAPAFWNEAGVKELAEANFNPKESIVWAYNNLPGYKERWEGRTMGNEKLLAESSDWKVFRNKFVEKATKWGMTANAAVDAYTVAVGARAVYLTKLKQFKNAGYSEEMAEKKALQRAAEAYNESQQSSEGAYLSPMQVSGTAMAAIFTTFKNSNFGYTRKTAQAVANILHKTKAGYKEESIAFMAKKMMREGLGEQEAKKYAEKLYYKSLYKDAVDVALFGAGLGLLWNMGGMALYLIFGDDDEEKAKMWEEIAFRGGLDALNGIPLGDMAIDLALNTKEGDVRNFKSPELMLFTDLKNVVRAFNSDAVKGANDLINMLVAAGVGVDAKTLTDVLVAIGDVENWADTEELGLFALRFLSAPQSQIDRLMVDDAMENGAENLGEVAQRYMEYKKGKDTPLTGWLYSDEGERKALEKYGERFARFLDERMEWLVEENDEFDVFYNSADAETKKVLASMRHKFLAGEEAEKYQKFSTSNLIKDILYGEGIEGLQYYDVTNAEDVDADFVFVSTMKDLQGVKKEFDESDNKEEFYNNHKRELDLYVELNRIKRYISNNKKDMQEHPENARERMDTIRELRTRAIELINDYNNE